jgi:hypothetical protein
MNKVREELLPPIIVDIIHTVMNRSEKLHVRDNACGRLEQIVNACEIAIADFRDRPFRKK